MEKRIMAFRYVFGGLLVALAGCGKPESASKAEMPAPMVTVATPVSREVTRYEMFTGRAEAIELVDVKARVSGFLTKIHFKRGDEVKAGAPLFEIDSAPFEAENAVAEAQIALAEARLTQMTAEFARYEQLGAAASKSEFDKAKANKLEAEASLKAAKSKTIGTKLNVEYCKLTSPIDGVVGDILVTSGNLIAGGAGTPTKLATIVSVNPIDFAFDLDENTVQRLQREVRENKVKLSKDGAIPVEAGLAVHGTAYPLKGNVTFFNNVVDSKTGTIRVKATFPNPKLQGGRELAPGMFARIRVPLGDPKPAFLVPESALLSDQADKFIYTVGADKKAIRLIAELGVQQGDMRVILSVRGPGDDKPRPLNPDEQIVVGGLQRVRPGLTLDPKPAAGK